MPVPIISLEFFRGIVIFVCVHGVLDIWLDRDQWTCLWSGNNQEQTIAASYSEPVERSL